MTVKIVFDSESTPTGWFDPENSGSLDREFSSTAVPLSLDVTRTSLVVTGRQVGLALGLAATRNNLRITGRNVGLTLSNNLTLPATRTNLRVTGRDAQSAVTLAASRANLRITGRQVGLALGQNFFLDVSRGTLRITGRPVTFTLIGKVTLPVTPAHLRVTGHEVGLQIITPTPPPPPAAGGGGRFDPVTMGRPNVRFQPNVRHQPPRKKREEEPLPVAAPTAPPLPPDLPLAPGISNLLRALIQRIDLPPLLPEVVGPAITRSQVRIAGHEADREPSEAQKQAGNFKKGHVHLLGLNISIENEVGSIRTGPGWAVVMKRPYGYIRGTQGNDGQQVDVYLGDHLTADNPVFVIDQQHLSGDFDEHKVVLGATDAADAEQLYDEHFPDGSGPSRRQATVRMSLERFKQWLDGETTEPAAEPEPPAPEPAPAPAPEPEPPPPPESIDQKIERLIGQAMAEVESRIAERDGEIARERALRHELEREALKLKRQQNNKLAIDIALRALLNRD